MHIGYWWESQMVRDHLEDQENIKMDFREIGWDGMVRIGLIWLRIRTSGGLL
jgi:hypothetical protein